MDSRDFTTDISLHSLTMHLILNTQIFTSKYVLETIRKLGVLQGLNLYYFLITKHASILGNKNAGTFIRMNSIKKKPYRKVVSKLSNAQTNCMILPLKSLPKVTTTGGIGRTFLKIVFNYIVFRLNGL